MQEGLPITVIVANNAGLGMVRDNMKGRRIAVDFSSMDFATLAQGMGCEGQRVTDADALANALAASRDANRAGRTVVIDVSVDPAASHVPVSDY